MKLTNTQAIDAQKSLKILTDLDLPVRTSLDIALLAIEIDKQVVAFCKVRDSLIRDYKVKLNIGEKSTQISYAGDDKSEEKAVEMLQKFTDKFNELLNLQTEDIVSEKIKLPSSIVIKPEILKSLVDLVEVT